MSSMVRSPALALLLAAGLAASPAMAQQRGASDGREWDEARARLLASTPAISIREAIARWELLNQSNGRMGFADYAGFLLSWPGFPEEAKMRGWAEAALERESVEAPRIVAFFDRFAPATNPARAQYAVALASLGRPQARDMALAAWRGGAMGDMAESAILSTHAPAITQADHDERMDALLWAGTVAQAQRQIVYVSAARRADFMARLAMLNGQDPANAGLSPTPDAMRDIGYVYNRVRMIRRNGGSAAGLLASRPPALAPAREPVRWVSELLSVARGADTASAVRISASIDDAFAPGTDIWRQGFRLRDDYTSLMWLGGTRALYDQGNPRAAVPLFHRYGAAARTPHTRTKGFYWAGRAAAQAGDSAEAARQFELAARYPDTFYGQLSLERLGRPLPDMNTAPTGTATPAERAEFNAKPLVQAVRELARGHDWRTTIRFFREVSEQAESEGEHLLVAELAQAIGRRDLAVILGQSAHNDGFGNFHTISFPLIPVPQGTNWTIIHAITRQESQFAMNAVSHAGARGLMQLMPGTAREQARMLGLEYDPQRLMTDAGYNLALGEGYFARMLANYGGSWPLAIAAYNAGPGNVNKWLRSNGDPRTGAVDWIEWIERIPFTETRGYVQKVLENAVVYEAMFPERARFRGPNPLSQMMGKRVPG